MVNTLIGTSSSGMADGNFSKASLYEPEGVSLFGDTLLIADTNKHQVRLANLVERTVATLTLTHVDRLTIPSEDTVDLPPLPMIEVKPGKVNFTLKFRLPVGTHLNPDAPSMVSIQPGEISIQLSHPVAEWSMNLAADKQMELDYAVYYCDEKDARLCMVANGTRILPLKITSVGQNHAHILIDLGEKMDENRLD